jgi:hypothetical protein
MLPMDVTLVDHSADSTDVGDLTGSNFDGDEVDDSEALEEQPEESRFYTCHVCGDNWLSIRREDEFGDCQLLFIHQMGVQPILKRVAHMQTPVLLNEQTVDHWEYYADEEEIGEGDWLGRLRDRRKVLKAVCCN